MPVIVPPPPAPSGAPCPECAREGKFVGVAPGGLRVFFCAECGENYAGKLMSGAAPAAGDRSTAPGPPHNQPPRVARFPVRRTAPEDLLLRVEFKTLADLAQEYADNISKGGLFIRTRHRPPVSSQVRVVVQLPDGNKLGGFARVAHVLDDPRHGGVVVAFTADDETFAGPLRRYLGRHLGGAT